MPAEELEITEATEEGVEFKFLNNPIEFIGENGKLKAVNLQKMKLGEPDSGGRRRPEPIVGDTEMLYLDSAVMAIGQHPDLSVLTVWIRQSVILYLPMREHSERHLTEFCSR